MKTVSMKASSSAAAVQEDISAPATTDKETAAVTVPVEDDPRVYPSVAGDFASSPDKIMRLAPENIKVVLGMDGRSVFPRDKKKILELRESIIREGILDPLQVMLGSKGEPILTKGFGRLDVVKALNNEGVDYPGSPLVPVIFDETTPERAFIRGIHHNIKGNYLSPMDIAYDIQALSNKPYSLSQAQIAKELGVTGAAISQTKLLLKLPEKGQKLVHDGIISAKHGQDIAQLDTVEEMEKEIETVLDGLKSGVKRSKLASATKTTRRDAAKAKGKKIKKGRHAGKDAGAGSRSMKELREFLEEYSIETQFGKVAAVFNILSAFIEGKGAGDGRNFAMKKLEEVLGKAKGKAA